MEIDINGQKIDVSNPAKVDKSTRIVLIQDPKFIAASKINTWSDEEIIHFQDKGFRPIRQEELPMVSTLVRPTDYNNDLKRGTVNHHDEWRNYSYHTVVIPDGTVVMNRNFCQAQPNTDAIVGENLIFAECNLVNVMIHPSWILKDCNNAQVWFTEDNGKDDRKYICAKHKDLPVDLVAPSNVLTAKDF